MTVTPVYPRDGEFLALEEIHAAALSRLPQDAATYLESGAGTELTLRANREAFSRWVIRPRPMTGVSDPKTNTEFLGIPLSVPVLTAPFGGDALFAPDGHLAVARANAACGIASIVPEVGSFSYEEVAAAAPAAARIAQLHPYDSFDAVAARVKAAGYEALCVTVDCPIVGFRARNRMARFHPDPAIWSGNVIHDGSPNIASTFGARMVPPWTWDKLADGDRQARDALDRQGHPHRRGRRGGPRRGRVGDPRLQPRRPPGRPGPGAASTCLPEIAAQVTGQRPGPARQRRPHRRRRLPRPGPWRLGGGHRPPGRLRPGGRGRARRPPHDRAAHPGTAHPDDPGGRPRHLVPHAGDVVARRP